MHLPSEPTSPFVGIDAKTMIVPGKPSFSGGRLRVLGDSDEGDCYHVMSRVGSDTEFFDDIEREALRKIMWKMAGFLGMRVLTYAVMGNHFHILIEVPKRR